MKYITTIIMAVLIFGVAAAPVFSGTAFAQSNETANEMRDKKQEISEERKEQHSEKREERAEHDSNNNRNDLDSKIDRYCTMTAQQKQQFHEDYPEIRIANPNCDTSEDTPRNSDTPRNIQEHRAQFMERFSSMSEDKKQRMQDKLDAMRENRGAMNQDSTRERIVDMTMEERQAMIQEIREQNRLERQERQNMTSEERQAFLAEQRAAMAEKRETYVSPRDQLGLGLAPEEVMCAEDKELVIRTSSGMPTCLGYNTVIVLMDRGLVTYPQ